MVAFMKFRKRVYIAGPYTKPDPCINTNRACAVWKQLWELGYAPFCPHWSHFQHTLLPMPYEVWLDFDNQFLVVCDALLRLPGESSGADKEVALARSLGIPVYHSVDELWVGMRPTQEEKEAAP
jgi:hypothetical protein